MIDAPELKPCPFCGGRAYILCDPEPDTNGAFYYVKCTSCRAKGAEFYSVETCPIFYGQVRDAWNTRADLAKPKVKPLVWGDAERNGMTAQADCPSGRYYIADRGEYGWLWFRPNTAPSGGRCKDEQAAKAAAQADYEKRILGALE